MKTSATHSPREWLQWEVEGENNKREKGEKTVIIIASHHID